MFQCGVILVCGDLQTSELGHQPRERRERRKRRDWLNESPIRLDAPNCMGVTRKMRPMFEPCVLAVREDVMFK